MRRKYKLKQIFKPYWLWEDHKAGLYDIRKKYSEIEEMDLSVLAKTLLSNPEHFKIVALKVVSEWKVSADVNLSNKSRNRQAWVGQASCCYALGVPEYITKYGWRMMTPDQQKEANQVADEVIKLWEKTHKCRKNTSLKMFMKPAKKE